jgi:hypothetical protein
MAKLSYTPGLAGTPHSLPGYLATCGEIIILLEVRERVLDMERK